jgi:elongation factor G
LELAVIRLQREFQIETVLEAPAVAYRETITKTVELEYTQNQSVGPSGQFARVKIRFEALVPGSGYVFENDAPDSAVPEEYLPGVERGLHSARASGVIAGFPTIDFKATLIDGAHHKVDSNIIAFDLAARACFQQAIPTAGPKLLEPMMKIEVVTPDVCLGEVIGDLMSRRCQMTGLDSRDGTHAITGMVPLSNMFGYVNNLNYMGQGRAQYTMHFDHYEPVPQSPPDGPGNFPGAMALR